MWVTRAEIGTGFKSALSDKCEISSLKFHAALDSNLYTELFDPSNLFPGCLLVFWQNICSRTWFVKSCSQNNAVARKYPKTKFLRWDFIFFKLVYFKILANLEKGKRLITIMLPSVVRNLLVPNGDWYFFPIFACSQMFSSMLVRKYQIWGSLMKQKTYLWARPPTATCVYVRDCLLHISLCPLCVICLLQL